ncbi:MAG: phosphodiester glycosidase family protein [Candidatus Sumerlaeaceae bacterium]
MTEAGSEGKPQGAIDPLSDIRATNTDPVLGLQAVVDDTGSPFGGPEVDSFLSFLRSQIEQLGFDYAGGTESLLGIAGSRLQWERRAFTMYPLYIEKLTISDTEHGDYLRQVRPGEWIVGKHVLDPAAPAYFEARREEWQYELKTLLLSRGNDVTGGFTYNALRVPADELKNGALDIRPLVLHAIAPDGSACDRGHLPSQAAIANAFWQTFWATGARRAERGETFPVAFLPIDRSSRFEFAAPFHERYVSLRRRLFGRTSILAYVIEILTRAEALLFDRRSNSFVVGVGFEPGLYEVAAADVLLAVRELNRTGFVDAFTAENEKVFAGWRELEKSHSAAVWPFNDTAQETVSDAGPKIRAESKSSDFIASVRADGPASEHLVRIHRVVPYGGCAYLYETVSEIAELRRRGKVQDFEGEVLAATNSTFFLNFPEEYATLHSAMNDAVAALVENGRTHQAKTLRRATFVLSRDGQAHVTTRAGNRLNSDVLVFEGESSSASYWQNSGKAFAENKFGPLFFGSVLVGNSIVETFEEIATEVPSNGWVIGDSEAFGGRIEPRNAVDVQVHEPSGSREVAIQHAFAVGPMLVESGSIVPLGESREEFQPIVLRDSPSFDESSGLSRTGLPPALLNCEKRGVPPTRFPYDWNRTRAPRTAIGVQRDGSVLLVVVDGRADLPHSIGATLAELAQLMLNLGCESAMNMDGGGSSVMFVNDSAVHPLKLRDHLRDGVVNLPSDMGGVERLLPVPLVLYRRPK